MAEHIAPLNRLFDFGNQEIFAEHNLIMDPSAVQRIGQQDCKDFFICLSENNQHWYDVYSLFKVNILSSTTCSSCQHVSSQDQNTPESSFLVFDCPAEDVSMSACIEAKLNSFEEHHQWRDEDGCKKVTVGRNSTRIQDMQKTEFLVCILSRLLSIEGNLHINDKKVPLGGNASIYDSNGELGVFEPIAVIHHSGVVTGNTTRGHYRADVLDKVSGGWIRTSDDEAPAEVSKKDVTSQGYIFLYKKAEVTIV